MEHLFTINDGVVSGARQLPSPNFNRRRRGAAINLLVIHNISLPPGKFGGNSIDQLFTNCLDSSAHPFFAEVAALQVSSHLLINRQGELTQYVNLNDRAWHAGVSSFDGIDNCNDYSVGIELEGTDDIAYTEPQYHCLQQITSKLCQTYPAITPHRIVGHCDIAPGRKTDPGSSFDWIKYKSSLQL